VTFLSDYMHCCRGSFRGVSGVLETPFGLDFTHTKELAVNQLLHFDNDFSYPAVAKE